MMIKKRHLAIFLLITYPIGILFGIGFNLLRIMGGIKLQSKERLPHWKRKLIVVSNHPSLLEPFLLPVLFFREYILNPFKYIPWSTPDRLNFYKPWYWFWIRPTLVPIERGNSGGRPKSLFRMKKILDANGIIILFPEGGRTFRGKKFLYSKNGRKIKELRDSIGWLVAKTGATVLPVWVEGTDKVLPNNKDRLSSMPCLRERVIIKIGYTLRFKATHKVSGTKQITKRITRALLELADEEQV